MTFTKSERIAICTIIAIIVILLIYKYLLLKTPPKRTAYFHNLDSIIESQQTEIDSLLRLDSIKKAERAKSFSKKNKPKTKNDTKKKATINDRKRPSPRSDSVVNQPINYKKVIPTVDLNAADTTLFKELPSIGSSFAKRIVEYREKLGGYIDKSQLLEVYGMDTARFEKIEKYIVIDSLYTVNLLRINYDSFKVLNKHPYLRYEDVKKIINHRERRGLITSWQQLSEVVGEGLNPRLASYVGFE